MLVSRSLGAWGTVVLAGMVLAGCTSQVNRAPVEDRGTTTTSSTSSSPSAAVKPLPGVENAGKPGYYTVKPGDTLIRVGLETGQNARDIAKWNNIDSPNSLEVGQVLRVAPPGVDPTATAARGVATARVDVRPLDSKPAPPAS